jgi:DNA replication ATP-dependent helicase Dna2
MFLNTDNIPALEVVKRERVCNPGEVKIVSQLVQGLRTCGVSDDAIGIISIYRAQLKLIKENLGTQDGKLEILTADRFQGRDKDCIIISMVRSNNQKQIGDLLRDWRRLNVTFTRAMSKLIVIGSRRTLEIEPTLQEFFRVIDSKKWSYNLPNDCTLIYTIPESEKIATTQNERKKFTTSTMVAKKVSQSSVLRDIVNELQ